MPDQSSQNRWRFPRAYYGDGNTEHKELRMSTSGSLYVTSAAGETPYVRGTSSAPVYVIDKGESDVHAGRTFTAYKFTDALTNGATASLTFKTDTSSTYAHLLVEVRRGRFDTVGANRPVKFEIIEGATWTAQTGTQVSIYNRDRNSAATSAIAHNGSASDFQVGSLIGTAQTGITGGTVIDRWDMPVGQHQEFSDPNVEFILKQNTRYALVATAITDSTASIGIKMNWSEET